MASHYSSSDEEPESEPVATAPPPPPPAPKKFDPLADLLGIPGDAGVTTGAANGAAASSQGGQLAVYQAGGPAGMMQRAVLEHTVQDRVANVKGIMSHSQQQQSQFSGFGVDGNNMQVALYGQHQPTLQQQQMQQQQMAMQQQQMAAYQTMAAYQSMAMYQSMAAGMNPMMAQQQQQQQMLLQQQQMAAAQRGMMPGAHYVPVPQGNSTVPAMQAQKQAHPTANYRVTKSSTTKRVNDSDLAFGPLLDRMKKKAP